MYKRGSSFALGACQDRSQVRGSLGNIMLIQSIDGWFGDVGLDPILGERRVKRAGHVWSFGSCWSFG